MRGAGGVNVGIVAAKRCNVLNTAETVGFWTSAIHLSEFMEPGSLVVLSERSRSTGGVVLVSPDASGESPVVTVKEAFDLDRNISIRVTMTADIDAFPEVYRSVSQALQIDRRHVLGVFNKDVLHAVLS